MFYLLLFSGFLAPIALWFVLNVDTKKEMIFWFLGWIVLSIFLASIKTAISIHECNLTSLEYDQFKNTCYKETK
jgi:hypothetical protein